MTKGKRAKKGGGPRAPAARVTAQQLYEQAQLALQYNDYDSARTALRKAAKMDPKNVEYLDALGALLAEIGPEDEAIEVLKKSVSLSPELGYEKYLYLGQLLEDPNQAVAAIRKGVQVLQAQHAAAQAASSSAAAGLSKVLSGALCSLSEMLLHQSIQQQQEQEGQQTQPCGEKTPGRSLVQAVAEEVDHLLALASAADPTSPEPGQALASLRYEQGRTAEALEALRRSMELWYTPSNKDEEGSEGGDEGVGRVGPARAAAAAAADEDEEMADASAGDASKDSDDSSEDDEEEGPSYEFRLECAKLLLELDETTTTAIDVLEGLIEEDDRVPDAWHLLALSYYSGHQYSEAAAVLAKGQALLTSLGAGPGDEITGIFADLESAIQEAMALEQQQQQQGAEVATGGGVVGEACGQ
ncbi:hypothetical protein Vretimale_7247 [Volvox reticuliferus]|uniref:TPR-like protein n=1 Tax=Volvox reticuliferus TaxID=1737510 RepID=A0A8J4LN07_9CHLO|nr:hypothetical protein Vretifemale_11205 [Volvox reticuliferus]GIM02373.1 hypothetical protein Vretimale_7247 [Volvox reticuliferus]